MEKETTKITVNRRNFFKIIAAAAAGAVISPKVLASLGEEAATSALSYADFTKAVSLLEQGPGSYTVVMHPELYRDLLNSWEQDLTAILGEQMGMAIDRLVLDEAQPFQRAMVEVDTRGETGRMLGVNIVCSAEIPDDEILFNYPTGAEDATITIGVENV